MEVFVIVAVLVLAFYVYICCTAIVPRVRGAREGLRWARWGAHDPLEIAREGPPELPKSWQQAPGRSTSSAPSRSAPRATFSPEARPGSAHAYRLEYRDEEAEKYGRGYVVVRNEDGRALSWKTLPRSEGLDSINVVGEDRRLEALQGPSFEPGKSLALVREPDNPYDQNAVAVYDANREHQVGYLPRDEAKRIAKKLDRGEELRCYSMWEQIDEDGARVQLRVLLLTDPASVRLPAGR